MANDEFAFTMGYLSHKYSINKRTANRMLKEASSLRKATLKLSVRAIFKFNKVESPQDPKVLIIYM